MHPHGMGLHREDKLTESRPLPPTPFYVSALFHVRRLHLVLIPEEAVAVPAVSVVVVVFVVVFVVVVVVVFVVAFVVVVVFVFVFMFVFVFVFQLECACSMTHRGGQFKGSVSLLITAYDATPMRAGAKMT